MSIGSITIYILDGLLRKIFRLHSSALCLFSMCLAMIMLAAPTNLKAGSLVTDSDFLDNPFDLYFLRPCLDGPGGLLAQGWGLQEIIDYNDAVCTPYFPAGGFDSSEAGYASSSNLGSSGAQSKAAQASSQQQVTGVKDRLEEIKKEQKGGWGLLLAAQQGETERFATNNESGFDSELKGIVVGLDYRFNDVLVAGLAVGDTQDEAVFNGNTGTLETSALAITAYFTFVPLENAYIDGYLGSSTLEFANTRVLTIGGDAINPVTFTGTTSGSFKGSQDLIGISAGYDWYMDDFAIGPYVAIDYSKTVLDAYDETGATNFELAFPGQTSSSRTSSLGANLSYTFGQDWGAIVPTMSMAMVHESSDAARSSDIRLIILPAVDTSTLQLQTDAPDKDYLLSSLGAVFAMNTGTQFFVTYEKISGHDFIDVWAISAGVLAEF